MQKKSIITGALLLVVAGLLLVYSPNLLTTVILAIMLVLSFVIFKSSSLKAGIAYAFNILMPIVDGLVVDEGKVRFDEKIYEYFIYVFDKYFITKFNL